MAIRKYFGYTVDEVPRYVYHPDKERNKCELTDSKIQEEYRLEYIGVDDWRQLIIGYLIKGQTFD